MSDTWPDVTARLDDLGHCLDSADDQVRIAVGRLVDAVRRWHEAQTELIDAGLADPAGRRAALRAEERLQRVDDVVSRIWSTATARATDLGSVRQALDDLALV